MKRIAFIFLAPWAMALCHAQEKVPVYQADTDVAADPDILKSAESFFAKGNCLTLSQIKQQLGRKSCELNLPSPNARPLDGRKLWWAARKAYVRIGTYYRSGSGKRWHLDLAGGCFLTRDGVVATAYHVVEPEKSMREGCFFVVDDEGVAYPVVEVLAANKVLDVCLLRVKKEGAEPLPLNEDILPGDRVFCFSDPEGERSYFSAGMVNRLAEGERDEKSGETPLLLNVSTDWAPGSSGSAVLDEYGNVVGLVSTIFALQDEDPPKKREAAATWMVLHEAVSAHDVKALIRGQK